MLTFLKVTNFALIDKMETDFTAGFNVLTGETGAGKSIIIKAVELLLGERASVEIIREGAKEAEVQAVFTIKKHIQDLLNQHNLASSDDSLVVRRVISSSGSKNFINGNVVNLQILKTIMTQVVNICGQHEHQLLVSPEEQLSLVDNFGDFQLDLKNLKALFSELKQIKKQIDDLCVDADIKEQRIDYLEFQLKEINEVNPQLSEEEELQSQEQKILGMKDLTELCNLAENTFYGEESSVISSLEVLQKKIKNALKHDNSISDIQQKLETTLSDLEEIADYFSSYFKKNNLDDNDLDYVINRLESFKKLKRKHGGSIEQVLQKQQELTTELNRLKTSDKMILDLEKQKKQVLAQYNKLSDTIHEARVKVSNKISEKVTKELQELKMVGSKFEIQIQPLTTLSSKGKDAVVFMISPNKGEGLKPLEKIASGGELSRIMLALTKVVTEKAPISLYIFDEIDAGIGGETGLVVGKKLQEIATNQQTICITHLPQVAVFASNHLVIEKFEKNNRTTSQVTPLINNTQKEQEIARMLGGNMAKNKALEHAQAMIELAHKG